MTKKIKEALEKIEEGSTTVEEFMIISLAKGFRFKDVYDYIRTYHNG